jgi:small subunit ribosomal protein S17
MKKTFKGKIVSIKMNKTVVVEVVRKTPHPLYKKLIKRESHYKADTGELSLTLGQNVVIAETRPISKGKFFKVVEVIK